MSVQLFCIALHCIHSYILGTNDTIRHIQLPRNSAAVPFLDPELIIRINKQTSTLESNPHLSSLLVALPFRLGGSTYVPLSMTLVSQYGDLDSEFRKVAPPIERPTLVLVCDAARGSIACAKLTGVTKKLATHLPSNSQPPVPPCKINLSRYSL